MAQKGLVNFFESYLERESLFKDKKVLQANYKPEEVLHRDTEIGQIANILAPALRMDKPSNLFLYGKTGSGKTLSAKYTTDEITQIAEQRGIPIKVIYINCKLSKVADTEYRLIAQICRSLDKVVPATGLPTDEVYKIFYSVLEKNQNILVLILDEIDQLVNKAGDEVIYNLTRINAELTKSQVSIIGISNDLVFTDSLDPRVKSSLSEEEIVFPPYNAIQLQHILKKRSKIAFRDGVIADGVIEKCSAYAAREHGDARRALELLRVAGEIAERTGKTNVEIEHIDEAEDKIERERIMDIVRTQPKQHQATLYSIIALQKKSTEVIFTGEIYEMYKKLCKSIGLRPLTQRRLSDIIAEFDMLGIINAKVISKGRFGRTREITLSIPQAMLSKVKTLLQQILEI